ncbi:MAG: fumarylacetoacetate hydrolase [Peptococcaceae bacterium BICA1-8]|nr:MAG: fumarylacetoacetate hydrolase [Peptococcaceae bacterium BICA1-8]
MRVIQYLENNSTKFAAVTDNGEIFILPFKDFFQLIEAAQTQGKTPFEVIVQHIDQAIPLNTPLEELELTVPIISPEVWAAGVTYERSRVARNYESKKDKLDVETYYDKVYNAERPEIFFKSTPARTAGPNKDLYLRSDSQWIIPEPELGLVINKNGKILGYTIGNDMSCRDIEGENPLYLPQAKIWKYSCSIGPAIRLAETVEDPYNFRIICRIFRDNTKVFEDSTMTSQLKRRYEELINFLVKDNHILDGTILLTGTCIVPPDEFTLKDGDLVEIEISDIGTLRNSIRKPT